MTANNNQTWVYLRGDGVYTVGFYDPDGRWVAESDHLMPQDAAIRVHWLNGGSVKDEDAQERIRQ